MLKRGIGALWDKRISNDTPASLDAIGSVGYVSINVEGCCEDGTMLSLDVEAITELSNNWAYDRSANEALNYLFLESTGTERRQRIFTIEAMHPTTDWVQISTWRNGDELPLPFWVHPSHLARYERGDE